MHIRLKKDILNIVNLMKKIQENLIKTEDISQRMDILEKCQQAAIAVGDKIEGNVIEDKYLIPILEMYCETVFQLSQCESITEDLKEYQSLCNQIEEFEVRIQELPIQYRVAFLPYKADMWDSLESIWLACSQDPRCECNVVPIPYYEANRIEKKWDARYDGNRFPDYVPITRFDYYHLDEMKPDVIYIHNPYDNCNFVTTVDPMFYSEELKKYTDHLVYVPYYVNGGFLAEDKKELPSCYNVHHMFFQSERMKESCNDMSYYDKIFALGSPKFDSIVLKAQQGVEMPETWKEIVGNRKTMMLNTTLADLLNNNEKMLNKLRSFFEYVKKEPRVAVIWRPHPLLEGTIKAMRPQLYEQYLSLVDFFVNEHIGVLDKGGNLSDTIILSDAYIGSSYSSVINLFTVAGKYIFLMNSEDIYPRKESINVDRRQIYQCDEEKGYYCSKECIEYTIENFIDDLSNGRLECIKEEQKKFASTIAANLDGTCGKKIHNYMMNVLEEENGIS